MAEQPNPSDETPSITTQDQTTSWGSRWFDAICAMAIVCSTVMMLLYGYLHRSELNHWIGHDSFSLLPKGHRGLSSNDEALVQKALDRQSVLANRQVIFMLHAPTPEATDLAKQEITKVLSTQGKNLLQPSSIQNQNAQAVLQFYAPHVLHMASTEQKHRLQQFSSEQWLIEAQQNASRPVSLGLSLAQDPLGNLSSWLLQQANKTRVYQGSSGDWQVDVDGHNFAVLFYQTLDDAFSLKTDESLTQVIQQAKQAAYDSSSDALVYTAGIPLHAAAATEQANREMTIFGSISTIAVITLIFLGYHSIRAVLAVTFSLLYGMLLAFFTTYWVFGEVHILTLVFGTSLIGVAEDYSFHYLAARQNNPKLTNHQLKRHIAPGMLLAFVTTALAYLFLGMPPFPALRQLAVFSAVGLFGALLVVWFLFPKLFTQMSPPTVLNRLFAAWWRYFVYHRVSLSPTVTKLLGLAFLVIIIMGWSKVRFQDDLRQLQNSPTALMNEQRFVGQALNESNSQFFLVTGENEQAVLQHEEDLRAALDQKLNAHPELNLRYRAISEWLPSIEHQKAIEQASVQVLPDLAQGMGMSGSALNTIQSQVGQYIAPKDWLNQEFTQMLQRQWLGQQSDGRFATVVNLTGTASLAELASLRQTTAELKHVIWVDNVTHYGQLLADYRQLVLIILGLSYLATLVVLWLRYRYKAILLLLPPLFGTLLSISLLGWLNIHVQLFTVLPLLLILGMGIDYGIFLIEHLHEQERMWMVTCLSSLSTILSLGMLGFSQTPALHILGLTLAVGIAMTWLSSAWLGKYLSRHLRNSDQNQQ